MPPALRILYVTPFWPTDRSFGAELRTAEIIAALRVVGRVDCLVLKIQDDDAARKVPPDPAGHERVIRLQPISPRSFAQRLRVAADSKFTQYYGHAVSEADAAALYRTLPDYDLVWFHQLRNANVFGRWSWPCSVMDLDDIPSLFLSSEAQNGPDLATRLRARRKIGVARRREGLLQQRFDVLTVCSEADRQYLGFADRVQVIPNGFTRPAQPPVRQAVSPPRLGFIGTLDYAPNVESVSWFARECWPLVKQAVPEARLRLIGKGSDGPAKPAGPDIDSLGWVADATAEIAGWSAMVVPVRTGGGTRIKIAEGFSRQCPIVSTSLGAYGYDAAPGREMYLADSPADFAAACVTAIRQPAGAAEMAERAWQLFLKKWTWDAIRPGVWSAVEQCLRRNGKALARPASP